MIYVLKTGTDFQIFILKFLGNF